MGCAICLNIQDDGLCVVYNKKPPKGFAAKCRHYATDPNARIEEQETTNDGQRLCVSSYCPFLLTDVPPGNYCTSGIRGEADYIVFSHLLLQDDTPCPRNLTI